MRRYKWAFAAIVAAGVLIGFVATRFIKPEYTAATTIWIEEGSARSPGGDYGPIRQQALVTDYAWQHLLRSFEVLEPVVRETRMYLRPADPADSLAFRGFEVADDVVPGQYRLRLDGAAATYALLNADGDVLETGAVGDSIGRELGFQWAPRRTLLRGGRTYDFNVASLRDVASHLGEELRPLLDTGGNFMTVYYSGPDPEQLASVLQHLSRRFVEVASRLKRAKLDTLTTILQNQLAIKQQDLDDAEVALETFRVSTITLPSDRGVTPVIPGVAETRDPALTNFFGLRESRTALQRDISSLQRVLDQGRATGRLTVEAFEVIPSVAESSELMDALGAVTAKRSELRSLGVRYTEQHPDYQQAQRELTQLEQQTVPALANALISDLEARLTEYETQITSAGAELRQIPARTMEEARLERQAEIQRTLYTDLKERYEAARLAAVSAVPDVQVLDEAKPPLEPSSDRRPQILSIALLASFGLGFLGVILLDRADRRLRFPEEVTHSLGLTILGTVPHLHRRRNGSLTEENAEQVIESLRAIRLGLMHAYGGGSGPMVVSVSSAGIGDGKSFVTSNLALAFAELGYNTLLIDGDVRRGCLHKLLGGSRRPGLTDLLKGDIRLDEAIQETRLPLLSLLPCGTRLARGPELLAKPEFKVVLDELRSRYDVILVDSPPIGAAVDPLVIGTLVGSMIFVLRNGITDREFAEAKLTALDRLPIRLLGAVLNDVSSNGVYRYYSYLPGYGTSDETGTAGEPLPVAMHPDRES